MDSVRPPVKGDWVFVWGQVTNERPHPDDVAVRFESHNEQYEALVRRDYVVVTGTLPPDVVRCSALFTEPGNSTYYVKCVLHHDHPGDHIDPEGRFYHEEEIVGYFEGK